MTKTCQNVECMAKRKKLEQELYFSRLKVEELEGDRVKWESAKQQLREQYQGLLEEVRRMRSD